MDYKAKLIEVLGLEADASDEVIANSAATFQDSIVAFKEATDKEVETMRNVAKEKEEVVAEKEKAEKEKAEAKAQLEAMVNTVDRLTKELVDYDIEKYGNRISDTDAVKAQLLSNRDATLAILKNTKSSEAKAPLHNSATAGQPKSVLDGGTTYTDAEAAFIRNRASEIQKLKNCSYQQSFVAAQREFEARKA